MGQRELVPRWPIEGGMAEEGQCRVARLEDSEVLEKDNTQASHELKKAVCGEVVLVKATLCPRAPARARFKARLLLLDPRPELLLQVVRRLVRRAREEVVPCRGREASDDAHKLARQVCQVSLAQHALVPAASL
jgi:hypothetical protein